MLFWSSLDFCVKNDNNSFFLLGDREFDLANSFMKENSASLVGKLVWAPHPELVWVPGTVRHADSLTVEVETVDKEFLRLAVKDLKDSTLIIAHANSLQNFQNLIDMEEFNEGAIIHQLRTRYKQDDIYTWIGNILISINPYKLLPIYTSEVLRKYIDLEKHGGATGLQNYAPHAYSVSGMAYKGLSLDENAQAVIISGESGAGKTEVTKLILQYLSEVAGSASGVEQEILLTNPILEAFGNSKTLRNNNSSRFGKWMEIIFDSSCRISGARIVNYLLEKSRVIKQAQNERNYHIFYQICSGAQGKTHLCLGDPSKFNYLNQSGCLTIAGVDDESGYQNVINAFKRLSFSEFELDEIHKIIAAILHLGNVEFEVKDNEGSKISNPEELDLVSKLLQLKSSDLEQAICYRAVKFRNDITQIPLKIADANDARHTIAKTLFGRLFDWLILKINDRLCKSKDTRVIGVLDIFGFEVFETNSFEQFCINFANEKLQSHFTQHIFLLEQNEYSSEGIPVDHVEFSDNSECIDIIEGNPGIIRLLDEEVVIPKGSDQALVEKLHRQFFPDEKSRHPKYSLIRKKKHIFIISHYAGDVEYDSNTNWLEKNKDRLHQSLGLAIKKSGSIIISNLFMDVSDADMDEKKVTGTIKVKSKGKDTLGTQFKKQLDNLMTTLKLAEPHFIRCLKPNYEKAADEFKSELVLRQIRYAGLFEAIRIRASGFTFRKPLHIFLKNYIVFLPAEHREVLQNIDDPTSARDGCQLILNLHESELNLHEIKLGHTKIFYKASQLEILESIRDRIILKHVISTQAKVRGALGRKRFKTIKHFFNKCKEALQNRDRSEIQDIMNSCAEQGLELFILAELRDLDQYLEVQDRVIQSVKEAIETSNIDRLEGALHQVDKLEIKKNSKESHVMKIIQQAEDELSRLKKLYQSKQQLRAAIENDDIETLSIAIEEARALGVDAEIIEQARSAKTELERQATVMSNVNRLLSTKCASDLDKFLKSELDTIKLTAERRVMIQQAEDFLLETFSNQILDFISREDEDSVLQLMKDIRESYIWPKSTEIIAKGRDFISQMQHRRDVLAEQQLQQAEAVEIEEEEEEGEAPPTVEAPRESDPPPLPLPPKCSVMRLLTSLTSPKFMLQLRRRRYLSPLTRPKELFHLIPR